MLSAQLYAQVTAAFTFSTQPGEFCVDFNNASTGPVTSSEWSVNGELIQQYSAAVDFWYCFPDSGCNEVKLVVRDAFGVADSSIQQVCIEAKTTLFMPNAFTPNGDGVNDVFYVYGSFIPENKYEMRIYDYWGGLVFSSFEPYKGWDGRGPAGRNIVQTGPYLLELIWFDVDNVEHTYRGAILLLQP